VRNLKAQGINVNKGYERKRKIMESEVTSESATKGINIQDLTQIILGEEQKLTTNPSRLVVDSLIELYNKAIVYYSALSDEKHLEYLQKL
jgi:translation initiation factor IF-2